MVSIVFFGCIQDKNNSNKENKNGMPEYLKSEYFSNDELLELKFNAVNKGDEYSFRRLILYYEYNVPKQYELLPIAIIMADKYKIKSAYFEIYRTIISMHSEGIYLDENFKNLKKNHKEFALSYLIEGARYKIPSCLEILEKLNRDGIGIEKNVKVADSLKKVFLKHYPNL